MSLSLTKVKDSLELAKFYINNKLNSVISYIDEDEIKEGDEKLTKIRLNQPNESFFPVINDYFKTEQTQRCYVCAESGAGKTTLIANYVREFHKQYPKAKIYLFSSKTECKVMDSMRFVERIHISDDILENPYTLAELSKNQKPCLTIFDDIEDFPNKKITKEVERLLNEILRNGRSFGIYSIYSSHQPSDYHRTRNQIFEATHIYTFPRRSGKDTYNYLYEKKLNLSKKTVNFINNSKSEFVCIKKNIPKVIISDKYILLV